MGAIVTFLCRFGGLKERNGFVDVTSQARLTPEVTIGETKRTEMQVRLVLINFCGELFVPEHGRIH